MRLRTLILATLALAVLADSAVARPEGTRTHAAKAETKQTAADTNTTADLLAKACAGRKTGDTVKVRQKDVICPPRRGVRDSGMPSDLKYIETLAAACKGNKTNDTVNVGGIRTKCPPQIVAGSSTRSEQGAQARKVIACNPSSTWPGWSRCCSYRHTYMMGWQMEWCAWTQN